MKWFRKYACRRCRDTLVVEGAHSVARCDCPAAKEALDKSLTDMHNYFNKFVSRPIGDYLEYQLDPVIARRVKELKLGLNGSRAHSWRALSIRVTGNEDQHTGWELERRACWTLGEECWCGCCESRKGT